LPGQLVGEAGWSPFRPGSYPEAGPGLNFQQYMAMDTSRIRDDLGYREAISQQEALARTVAWERSQPPKNIDLRQFDYAAEDRLLAH
jgi:nucleoside-diphosphate-sugar epimerase